MERCKHGMLAQTCNLCNQQKRQEELAKQLPQNRGKTTDHGRKAVPSEKAQSFRLIRVHAKKGHASLEQLGPLVSTVHILGHPFLWLIELILGGAANVKYIQVIPSMVAKFGQPHRDLCAARGVQIIGGHVEPSMAWDDGEFHETGLYKAQQRFMEGLEGEQKALFDELEGFGFEEAECALYYYGLRDHERKSQSVLYMDYGLSVSGLISRWVNGVIRYLDDSYKTGKDSVLKAGALKKRVARLRQRFQSAANIQEFHDKLKAEYGIDEFPVGIKPARLETLGKIWLAKKSGELDRLRVEHSNQRQALMLRFGLYAGYPSVYRTLQEVGGIMCITRERVRQLEEGALEKLGIYEDGDAS